MTIAKVSTGLLEAVINVVEYKLHDIATFTNQGIERTRKRGKIGSIKYNFYEDADEDLIVKLILTYSNRDGILERRQLMIRSDDRNRIKNDVPLQIMEEDDFIKSDLNFGNNPHDGVEANDEVKAFYTNDDSDLQEFL